MKEKDVIEKEINYVLEAIKKIKEKHGRGKPEKSFVGAIECPKCGATLSYSISSYNGHIWGKCANVGKNCDVGWMM